jgi:hypothetical protein
MKCLIVNFPFSVFETGIDTPRLLLFFMDCAQRRKEIHGWFQLFILKFRPIFVLNYELKQLRKQLSKITPTELFYGITQTKQFTANPLYVSARQ